MRHSERGGQDPRNQTIHTVFWQVTSTTNKIWNKPCFRDIYSFFSIPFGETTGGEHRFQPPRPKGPLNDGKDAYDASYLNYITDW